MYWYGLSGLLFWVLIAVGMVALMRMFLWGDRRPRPPYQDYEAPGPYSRPSPPAGSGVPAGHGQATAEQILAERFARGEIDEDEFWQRMTTLRAGRPDDSAPGSS